jgi:hypothetical protein
MLKCFVARFGRTVCHVELRPSSEGHDRIIARPWAQDGSRIRPVLTEDGQYPEFLADAEGAAIIGAFEFLQQRFGPMADRPLACRTPGDHQKLLDLPLRWSDETPDTVSPDGRK